MERRNSETRRLTRYWQVLIMGFLKENPGRFERVGTETWSSNKTSDSCGHRNWGNKIVGKNFVGLQVWVFGKQTTQQRLSRTPDCPQRAHTTNRKTMVPSVPVLHASPTSRILGCQSWPSINFGGFHHSYSDAVQKKFPRNSPVLITDRLRRWNGTIKP